MHRLVSSLPSWMKRYLSQDPQEKTWTCEVCGPMAPIMMQEGGYLRRRCACEQRAEELRRRMDVPLTLHQALARTQTEQTYTWLGKKWYAEGLLNKTFAAFERSHQREAFDHALQFARRPQGTLLLYGSFGLGKTHLLAAIANQLREEGKPCLFATAILLFDAIGDRLSSAQDYHDLIRRAISSPLLLLDDIDKPKPSQFRQEIYYQLIDGRTRAGRPLVISANCTLTQLGRYVGGATRSRLMMGLTPVQMKGTDYRKGMRM